MPLRHGVKRLTLVISSMGEGGAERVLSILSDYWAEQGYEITLLLFSQEMETAYVLNSRINVRTLALQGESGGLMKAMSENWRRIRLLRREISRSRPDVVLSFMTETSVLCVLAMVGKVTPVVACEHSDPFQDPESRVWRILRWRVFRRADQVVVLNRYARSYFPSVIRQKTRIIPNPVSPVHGQRNPEKCILAVGRLVPVKRYDLLIEAFSLLYHQYPDWSLTILGEGELRPQLERQIEAYGLEDSVSLPGWVPDPDKHLLKASLFVLCSEHEGFPMALCEAMAAGVASVSVRYHCGIEDIINDGENGLIVDVGDVQSLSQAMDTLMNDLMLRESLGIEAKRSMRLFNCENVGKYWDSLFAKLLPEKNKTGQGSLINK